MGHHGRVEECGGFQRILTRKQRADQQLPNAGQWLFLRYVRAHLFVVREQDGFDFKMPRLEFHHNRLQMGFHFNLAQDLRARENTANDLRFSRDERTDDHPRTFRMERHVMAAQVKRLPRDGGTHGCG